MSKGSPWIYNGLPFEETPTDQHGFIYCITNRLNQKKYVGMKYFWFSDTKQVKGKTKKIKKESDWKTYYGSAAIVAEEIEKHGIENFDRVILRICKTLGETKYQEVKEQFARNVLEAKTENGEPEYYNGNIHMKFTRTNIGLPKDHFKKKE